MSSVGEAILTARRASGLNQTDLADKAGVTQAALSRYENDLREPSADVLASLASAMGVTPRLLERATRLQGALAVDAHMRRRATAKAGTWRQLEAQLNMLRLHLQQLWEEVAAKAPNRVPGFDPIDVDPEEAALITRMQWKMPIGPVRNVTQWLESAGIVVHEADFGTTRVDALSQWIDDLPVVLINAALPTDRKRLTLAHELGHLCLHRVEVSDDVETDANAFAAEFLMPSSVIRSQLRNITIGTLHDLKREWGVSMQALIERAHRLGTLPSNQRTQLYKQFSARRWRTREPLSDELPPERPKLIHALAKALENRGLTPVEINEIVGFDAESKNNPFNLTAALDDRAVTQLRLVD